MTEGFDQRLATAGEHYGRLCVGIDPHESLLNSWGLSVDADGVREFSLRCVEAFTGYVALIKPQIAFYERFGSKGLQALEDTLAAIRSANDALSSEVPASLVVADAKRGDIGSTMEGYAYAWLDDRSPLACDAVTLTPYLGVGSLLPAIEMAGREGRGVFVMAANSNPEAEAFQASALGSEEDAPSVAQFMVDECASLNEVPGTGHVGVVVGATVKNPPVLDHLNAPVLMPGVGAQGATFEDVARIAGRNAHLAFPNVSRSVLSAGPNVEDLRKRAKDVSDEAKRALA